MKKKLLSIFTAVVLTVSMAACGKGSGADNVDKDKSKSVGEEVTLSVMVTTRPTTDAKDFYLDWLPELVKEKYPNINIEVEQLPTDQYKQTVRLKFASGQDRISLHGGLDFRLRI